MSSSYPKVSVIVAAYNKEAFVDDTVESVLNQTFSDYEILIVNDGSLDRTLKKAHSWEQKDKRIKVINLPQNRGAAAARNRALDAAAGKYMAFLDCDDRWYPNKLWQQIQAMEELGLRITFTPYRLINQKGASMGKCVDCKVPLEITYQDLLRKRATFGCSTVIVTRELVEGKRIPNLTTGQDYAFWLSLLRQGVTAKRMPQPLSEYRITPGSLSRNKIRKAWQQWHIYRENERLPFNEAMECWLNYAWRAVFRK